jgi:hypothetical protein
MRSSSRACAPGKLTALPLSVGAELGAFDVERRRLGIERAVIVAAALAGKPGLSALSIR